jgi:hypothetical protein
LDVVKGLGPQQLETGIVGKWNMNNWEYLLENAIIRDDQLSDSKYWIWGEGIPTDIHTFDGYRVVVLSAPSYSRGLSVQRAFKNLKAAIAIKEILSEEEIRGWMNRFKQSV